MQLFLNGVASAAGVVAGILFLRFWRETGDRLFGWFAFAFWTLAVHWTAVSLVAPAEEARHVFYVLRLVAFVLILAGIYEKNSKGRY